jgi:DNA-binding response OmpR family regulator
MNLTKIFRERSVAAAMPIIVLTASGGPEEWRQLVRLGADRLLLKPVVGNDVVTMVRCTLRERSGAALPLVA